METTNAYRKRFPLEVSFCSYYVDYFLKVLAGKKVYSECQCYSSHTPLARVDNVFELEGKTILLEVKLNIALESKFVREDSVLAAFLSGKYERECVEKNTSIVYPFGFNLSQKKAVDNALCNPISIIEGPPGTGKTQTILNIIANAVMRGESVAVVSSNNSATANVLEKLKKYGVDFIAAPLGSSANREAFIESQNSNLPDMRAWREATSDLSTMREDEVRCLIICIITMRMHEKMQCENTAEYPRSIVKT